MFWLTQLINCDTVIAHNGDEPPKDHKEIAGSEVRNGYLPQRLRSKSVPSTATWLVSLIHLVTMCWHSQHWGYSEEPPGSVKFCCTPLLLLYIALYTNMNVYIQMLWHCTLPLASSPINRSLEPTLKITTSCTANCPTATLVAQARKSTVAARKGNMQQKAKN